MALDTVLADHCYFRSTEDPNFGNSDSPAQLETRRSKRQKERRLPSLGLTPIRHFDEYDSTKLAPCRIARWTSLFAPRRRRKKEKPSRKRREVFFSKRPGTDEGSNDDASSPMKPPPKSPSAAEAWKRLLHVRMNLVYKAQQETLRLWQLIQEENLERSTKSSGIESQASPTTTTQTTGATSQVEQPKCLDANTCNQRVKEIFDLIEPLLSNTGYKLDAPATVKKTEHVTQTILRHNSASNMLQCNGTSNVQPSVASNMPLLNATLKVPQRSDASNVPQRTGTVKRSRQEVKFQLRNPYSAVLNNGLHLVKKDAALKHSETEYTTSKQVNGGMPVHCETECVEPQHGGDEVNGYDTMECSETEQLTPVHSETELVMKHKKRKRRRKKVTRAHVPGSRQFCVSHKFSIVYTTVSPIW